MNLSLSGESEGPLGLSAPQTAGEVPAAPGEGSTLAGNSKGLSAEGLQAARDALLNPRQQLRSAVALQIGQLAEVSATISRLHGLLEAAGAEWGMWVDRNRLSQEATGQFLQELTEAKRRQEEALSGICHGMTAARDLDTARLEAGLRNLSAAAQDLRNATEIVSGTGKRFGHQVSETIQAWEGSLGASLDRAQERLEEPIGKVGKVLRPLTWIGASVGGLLVLDIVLRVWR